MTKCKDRQERQFYILSTKKYGWTKDILTHKIEVNSFEKYLLGQHNFENTLPDTIKNQAVLAVKDEYSFDFLELEEEHSEAELERALIKNIRFCKFLPKYKGKMELYLNILNDRVKLPHENPSIGIIICKSKKRTIVEYALKDSHQPIGVATYSLTTHLPEFYKELLPDTEKIAEKLIN